VGVDVFFVLSGFLISRLLIEERAATGRVSLRSFYARRGLRLLPALLLVLAFVAAAPRLLANVGNVRQLVNW
jgi:peptidoglycan/LPS O-acetylase OafA/YrhL